MDTATLTRIGGRTVNEDCAARVRKGSAELVVVCDGLGGHGFGEVASKTAVDAAVEAFANYGDAPDFLERAAEAIQEAVLAKQDESPRYHDMRTTLVLLRVTGGSARWLHVGDSRLYMFRGKSVLAQTDDHSVPGMLVRMGELKLKQIRNHPDRNRVLRVVGDREMGIKYDLSEVTPVQPGDAFLLCTDGYWELIDEKQMIKLLKKAPTAADWLESMAKIVEKNGRGRNMDNYTAGAVIV